MTPLTGCYYGHLAVGQTRLLWASRSIDSVLEDPATSDKLRAKLLLVRAATHFADELGLEVTGQYTNYVPWPEDRVITTVVATRPAELEPAGFSFPFLGTLPYKGFFAPERAERQAEELRKQGLDVCISAVTAYSTLGWLDDPITEPMLRSSDGRLVETIVHELVHATVYAKDEPEFNESIATFIGQEASIAFFRERAQRPADLAGPAGSDDGDPSTSPAPSEPALSLADAQAARVRDARRLARALGEFRREVESFYADQAPRSAQAGKPEHAKQTGDAAPSTTSQASLERAAMETRVRRQLSQLPLEASSREEVERMAQRMRLNDACLALQGTYSEDLERHGEVFSALGGDLAALVAQLRTAAAAENPREDFFRNAANR